jgi:hypothetical protein
MKNAREYVANVSKKPWESLPRIEPVRSSFEKDSGGDFLPVCSRYVHDTFTEDCHKDWRKLHLSLGHFGSDLQRLAGGQRTAVSTLWFLRV